jgi:hypothetical protein
MLTDLSISPTPLAKSSALAAPSRELLDWQGLTIEVRASQKTAIVDFLITLSDHDPALARSLAHIIALRCPWFREA